MADYRKHPEDVMGEREQTDRLEYDPATDTYWLQHDWNSDTNVGTAVALAVAAITNTPPTEFEPVYEVVNTDALTHLFRFPPENTRQERGGHVSFSVHDCEVTVYANGHIEIVPRGGV